MGNETLHQLLLEEWQLNYKDNPNGDFTYDGPINWSKWEAAQPKILLLLKESWDGYEPTQIPNTINNSFSRNISRWRYAINELYNDTNKYPEYPNNDLLAQPENSFIDIALVEIKKLNENKSSSSWSEIKQYALHDKGFLKRQIDLINPNIVLCCNTQECGYDIVYDDIDFERLSPSVEKCTTWKFDDRLLIDFFHPSCRKEPKMLFDTLVKILTSENVFEKFSWNKSK